MNDIRASDNTRGRDDPPMTAGEHLDELRRRVIFALAAVVVGFIACWLFKGPLMRLAARPHVQAMRALGLPPALRFIRYPERLYAYLRLALVAGLVFASPVVIGQMWAYVRRGMYRRERRWVLRLAPASIILFLAGVAFAFFIVVPVGLRFLAGIGDGGILPAITVGSYLSLVLTLTLAMGAVFQLPLVMLLLCGAGVATAGTFRAQRRFAIVGILFLGAVLTPPDPFTQLAMALPMILLYEFGIAICEPRARHLVPLALLVLLVLAAPVAGRYWLNRQDARAGRVVAGEGTAAPESARKAGTGSPARPLRPCDVIGVGDEVSAMADSPLVIELGKLGRGRIVLREKAAIAILGRRVVRLAKGEIYVSCGEKTSLRVLAGEVAFDVRGGEADLALTAEDVSATAVRGACGFAIHGSRGTITAGKRRWFPRREEAVSVRAAIEWLPANTVPQSEGDR